MSIAAMSEQTEAPAQVDRFAAAVFCAIKSQKDRVIEVSTPYNSKDTELAERIDELLSPKIRGLVPNNNKRYERILDTIGRLTKARDVVYDLKVPGKYSRLVLRCVSSESSLTLPSSANARCLPTGNKKRQPVKRATGQRRG